MIELPRDFIDEMIQTLGRDEAAQLCFALTETVSPVSVRRHCEVAENAVPWCKYGEYLSERPTFTLDPLFHAGEYYVQEASSMFIAQAYARMDSDLVSAVLDLCAAPGGKSTLWRTLIPDEATLVANEPNRQRAEILNENCIKWGHPRTVVTNAWPKDFGKNCRAVFDVIAADVPCSGEGMFRKDVNSRAEWSLKNVEKCAALQRSIIEDVWPALRAGGWLVYSTCTFNTKENEENVRWICENLGAKVVRIPVEKEWGIVETDCGCHFYPHRAKGEGFFLALLQKDGDGKTAKLPQKWDKLRPFSREMYVEKGKKKVPQHWMALTDCEEREHFPSWELNREDALRYLRHEALQLPPEASRGYVIVCYEGRPLGFVNNLGTRANNMYPPEWRIRNL